MRTIKCVCEQQGLLLIGKNYDRNKDGSVPCYEDGIAHYEFKSPSLLFGVAAGYSKIQRANFNYGIEGAIVNPDGDELDHVSSYTDGVAYVKKYEAFDRYNNRFTPNFYRVVAL